jgi:hypothetical protein
VIKVDVGVGFIENIAPHPGISPHNGRWSLRFGVEESEGSIVEIGMDHDEFVRLYGEIRTRLVGDDRL